MKESPAGTTVLTIAAFGDSITQAKEVEPELRWPSLLERGLACVLGGREVKVFNAGAGGNTSREGLARMDDVLANGPNIVLVEFGGNDAFPDLPRHVDLEEFARNLQTIRERVEVANATVVYLTFPPCVDEWAAESATPYYQERGGADAVVERYRQATRDFTGRNGLPLIDTDKAVRAACGRDGHELYFQRDGVHLTEAGNRVFYECVRAAVLPLVEG